MDQPVVRCAVSEALFGFRCLLAFLKGFQARIRWVAYDPTEETVPIVNATERTIARIAGKVDVSSAIKKRRDQLLQRAASRTSRE